MMWKGFLITVGVAFLATVVGFLLAKKIFKAEISMEYNRMASLIIALIAAGAGTIWATNVQIALWVSFIGGILASTYFLNKKLNLTQATAAKVSACAIVSSYFFAALFVVVFQVAKVFI